jgi:hypothetical protein
MNARHQQVQINRLRRGVQPPPEVILDEAPMVLSAVHYLTPIWATATTQTEPEDPIPLATAEDLRLNEHRAQIETYFQFLEATRTRHMTRREHMGLAHDIYQAVRRHILNVLEVQFPNPEQRNSRVLYVLSNLGHMCTHAETWNIQPTAAANDPK